METPCFVAGFHSKKRGRFLLSAFHFGWTVVPGASSGKRSRDIKEKKVQLVKPTVRIPQLVSTASRKAKHKFLTLCRKEKK